MLLTNQKGAFDVIQAFMVYIVCEYLVKDVYIYIYSDFDIYALILFT